MATKVGPHGCFSLSSKSECKYNLFQHLYFSQDKSILFAVEKACFLFLLFWSGKNMFHGAYYLDTHVTRFV